MLFIFGVSPKTVKAEQGQFICPVCRQNTRYQIQQQRSYFSLFFIKLFPVSKAKNPHLICHSCGTVMPPDVLHHP